jgi:hypothetical protein
LQLGPYTFPCRFKSKDYEIHDSSIRKAAPVCDKFFLQLLEVKPIDGLWLSQEGKIMGHEQYLLE